MRIAFVFLSLLVNFQASALTLEQYIGKIANEYNAVSIGTWGYTKAAKHGGDIDAVNGKRIDAISSCENALKNIEALGPWEGDARLQSEMISFYQKSLTILKKRYPDLAQKEKSKSESKDKLVAFFALEKKVRDDYESAVSSASAMLTQFRKEKNVNVKGDESVFVARITKTGRVYDYFNKVYVIVHSCLIEEANLMSAYNEKDEAKLAASMDKLKTVVNAGMNDLAAIEAFDGADDRLRKPTNQLLNFLKEVAEIHAPKQLTYINGKKEVDELIRKFKAKAKKTREEGEAIKAKGRANEKLRVEVNSANGVMNDRRIYAVNTWNNDAVNFIEKNVPQ